MHIIVNILLLFVFLTALFYFKIPDLENDNFIQHKFIIFFSLFCLQFVILLLAKIVGKCKIDIKEISISSLTIAVTGIVGYSLYNDLMFTGNAVNLFGDEKFQYLNVSIILILFITAIKILQLLFNNKTDDCVKY
jgi:hypothetical protein